MESGDRMPEGDALRQLARQLAAVADTGELLTILCDAAKRQACAGGAAVVRADQETGDIVAACGMLASAKGKRFVMRGSLLLEMQQSRDVVGVDNVQADARPITKVIPEVAIGPMLIAPLLAHDELIGGLAVARDPGAPPFKSEDREQLRLIADHAALALWKADLLEQARAADTAKGRFLATISHELRTPLTALTGYNELLVDEVLGAISDAQRDILERMRSVTQHLTAMIEDVLAYSSLEMGHEVIRPTEFLLVDLVNAVAAVADPLAKQKGITLTVQVPDPTLRITTDIDRARQILINLAGNAVKFTDKGGVHIAVSTTDRGIRISVTDSGIGIAGAQQKNLFKPFAQVDTGLTRRHGGTGLGLYISAQLAKLLGGQIELRSQAGQGATFTLVLPRSR
jgi:signal transduction histidine kinase